LKSPVIKCAIGESLIDFAQIGRPEFEELESVLVEFAVKDDLIRFVFVVLEIQVVSEIPFGHHSLEVVKKSGRERRDEILRLHFRDVKFHRINGILGNVVFQVRMEFDLIQSSGRSRINTDKIRPEYKIVIEFSLRDMDIRRSNAFVVDQKI